MRALKRKWVKFLSITEQFYEYWILQVSKNFDIPVLRRIAGVFGAPSEDNPKALPEAEAQYFTISCYKTLVSLGDLKRYGHVASTKKPIYLERALDLYSLAHDLVPGRGHAHHQMGIVALAQEDDFAALFYFYMSMTAVQPHPGAKNNLENYFKKAHDQDRKGVLIRQQPGPPLKTLVKWFSKLQGLYYTDFNNGREIHKKNELENEVFHRIQSVIEKSEDLDSTFVSRMAQVAICAFEAANRQSQGTFTSPTVLF